MTEFNRRTVLGAAAAATALAGAGRAQGPGRGLRVGVVGAGWFGKVDSQALMQVAPVDFIAYADVDWQMLAGAGEEAKILKGAVQPLKEEPALYADYREMLAAHDFDIVLIDTPDHWHALPMIAAADKGAHIYLQKPICVDVREGRAMVDAAERNNVVVQVGTQRRTTPHLIEAKRDIIEAGHLGAIGHVEVFGYFPQRPLEMPVTDIPAHLDWNAYCGPAPLIEYREGLHPINWRAFDEFCNGLIGDIGVHFIDTIRWMLGLGWPSRVYSEAGVYVDKKSPATIPDTQIASFKFGDLLMTWTNRVWGHPADPTLPWGAVLHGEKGDLRISVDFYEFVPLEGDKIRKEAIRDTDQFPHEYEIEAWRALINTNNRAQMRDFLRAIESGTPPAAPIMEGYISTACCALANLSQTLGRAIVWDGENEKVIGDKEANKMLARPYRGPWKHPAG